MSQIVHIADHKRNSIAATEAARLQWANTTASSVLGILGDMRIPFGQFADFLRRVERRGGPDRTTVLEFAGMLVEARLAACSERPHPEQLDIGEQLQLPMAHCPCFTGPAMTTTCANPPGAQYEKSP